MMPEAVTATRVLKVIRHYYTIIRPHEVVLTRTGVHDIGGSRICRETRNNAMYYSSSSSSWINVVTGLLYNEVSNETDLEWYGTIHRSLKNITFMKW